MKRAQARPLSDSSAARLIAWRRLRWRLRAGWRAAVNLRRAPDRPWLPVLAIGLIASIPLLVALGLGALLAPSTAEVDSVGAIATSSEELPQLGFVQSPLTGDSPAEQPASPYAAIAIPSPTPPPGRLQPSTHVVTDGETLLELADRYGLRPESVLWANDLPNPDLIVIGQKLIIPPVDGLVYTVEPGDSLAGIALHYGLDFEQVAVANGIDDANELPIGIDLVLPGGRPVAPSSVVAAGPNTAPDAVRAPNLTASLTAAVAQNPLPDNVSDLLAAAWLYTDGPNTLFAGPDPGARRYIAVPTNMRLERTGDLAGRRIPVRMPGDGRTRQAMSGWVDSDNLEPTRAPAPRELPRAYPADTRMDIFHAFVPYRGQLDGSSYSEANCGPTAIGMVMESFGVVVSPPRLRAQVLDAQHMWGNSTGTLMTALAAVVEDNGLSTYGLRDDGDIRRWTLDDLRAQLRLRRPIVVQARYRGLPGREGSYYFGDHYIVVTGVLDDGFLYNDPIDFDGLGWDRVMSGDRLYRAMDASDTRFAHAAFAIGP